MHTKKLHITVIAALALVTWTGACAHDESAAASPATDEARNSWGADGTWKAAAEPCESCPQVGRKPDPARIYDVPVGDSPVRGAETAKVTIVVACDFECGYCRRVQPTLERVRETYGQSVRLAFKHNPLPFHREAMGAALAAEAAREQGKFWEMHDLLLAGQQELGAERYVELAAELGLDVSRFENDLQSSALRTRVEEDQKLVRSLGGKGTPSFWVNGRFLNGAQPFGRFRDLIFDLLADRDRPAGSEPAGDSRGGQDSDCGCGAEPSSP